MFLSVLPPDVSLTPHTLLHAVSTVRRFWDYGGLLWYLGVPDSVMNQIRDSQSYSSEEEKRLAGLQYYLQTVPGVSWGMIAGMLWSLEEHTALDTVRQYLPHKHGEYLYIHVYICTYSYTDSLSTQVHCTSVYVHVLFYV